MQSSLFCHGYFIAKRGYKKINNERNYNNRTVCMNVSTTPFPFYCGIPDLNIPSHEPYMIVPPHLNKIGPDITSDTLPDTIYFSLWKNYVHTFD